MRVQHCFVICLLAFLGGCKPGEVPKISPVDTTELAVMTTALRPQLIREHILDKDGAWYSPRFFPNKPDPSPDATVADKLLKRLSPAFRFPGVDPASLPESFQGMLTADAKVEKAATSFQVTQGVDKLTVSLLALLDWNGDKREDWLLLCRIEPQTMPGVRRDYYLVLTDPSSATLVPQVAAVRECVRNECHTLASAAEPGLVQESNHMEMLQGQHSVTEPPLPKGQGAVPRKETVVHESSPVSEKRLAQ